MRLLMIRHSRSTRLSHDRFGRRFDASLDDTYSKDIDLTKKHLKENYNLKTTAVFSSNAIRCRQTLELCLPGASQILISEFEPYHSGFFESLRDSDVKAGWPEYYDLDFKRKFLNPRYGEESIYTQAQRILPGIGLMLSQSNGHDIVLCTHCSVMNVIGCFLLGNTDATSYANGTFEVCESQYVEMIGGLSRWKVNSSSNTKFNADTEKAENLVK
jgi:broad specificity phosphatase PhoE